MEIKNTKYIVIPEYYWTNKKSSKNKGKPITCTTNSINYLVEVGHCGGNHELTEVMCEPTVLILNGAWELYSMVKGNRIDGAQRIERFNHWW